MYAYPPEQVHASVLALPHVLHHVGPCKSDLDPLATSPQSKLLERNPPELPVTNPINPKFLIRVHMPTIVSLAFFELRTSSDKALTQSILQGGCLKKGLIWVCQELTQDLCKWKADYLALKQTWNLRLACLEPYKETNTTTFILLPGRAG